MKNLMMRVSCMLFATACFAQDQNVLHQIEQQLSSGKTVTNILTDSQYMSLHPQTAFRDIIKRFASAGVITLVTPTEQGTRITIKGNVIDENNKPHENVLVYVYHTDNKGWYADAAAHNPGMEGDRKHARLFGYLKTNKDGSFEFKTIHPQGYPNSDLPQHIHFEVFSNEGENLIVTELLFDEDPRLTAPVRQHMLAEGAQVAADKGTKKSPLYNYVIKIK